jgi:hypothetical protein
MARFAKIVAAVALLGTAAAPAAAQYQYPQQQYPQQQYPQDQYPQQQYPQAYPQGQQGYPQGQYPYPDQSYGTNQNAIGAVIDQLIGNRYNVSDRQAIHQCAYAAVQRAQGYNYGGGYGYPGYHSYLRVTAINDVERRSNSVRVRGMLGSGGRYNTQPYDPRYGYNGGGYGYGGAAFNFRCDVDYRGYVRNVHVDPAYRHY